ncbi:amidase [Ferrovibrio sp.]|uniref:amidase n=1 Tax=Ferrovibrio sp. TaxID=1917215 RepID=UPI0026157D6F|nr:amidase [Ferrovibrio sp.]
MKSDALEWISARDAAAAIADGRITSRELTEACLASIERQEDTVGAWAFLDRDLALLQADMADDAHRAGRPHGPLHGVPVGVKDIFDTHDMPTGDGSPLHAGRTPRRDAAAVALLRQAGAVILGKTVTTEFAVYHPGKTANPLDPARTPGGSSSGSAAAVAAGMVPLAIGSQTNGSVIRPASFCGVVGYKPSFGLIPRTGALRLSRALDHVGVFARSVEDAALIAECMIGFDPEDAATRPQRMPLRQTAVSTPPVTPRLAFVPSPLWDQAGEDTHAGFAELVEALGETIERFDLPSAFGNAIAWHKTLMETDLAVNLSREYEQSPEQISPVLREMIARGRSGHSSFDYARAIEAIEALNAALEDAFFAYDAFVTPAAPGVAPLGLQATGSPAFCTLWTFCGLPAVTIPLLQGEGGMPIGVQLVGPRGSDARLLRTANWLQNFDFT